MDYLPDFFRVILLVCSGWTVGWGLETLLLGRKKVSGQALQTLTGIGRWIGAATGFGIVLRYRMLPAGWPDIGVLGWKVSCIFIATVFLARLLGRYVLDNTSDLMHHLPSTSLVQNMAKGVVYVIGFLVMLQTIGVSVAPMLTALGVGGLAVALALQDTLSNLFAGIQILASRNIQPGQFIRLQSGEDGYVADISWRNTSIRTMPNQLVIIPNAKLAASIITNANLPDPEVGMRVDVGVHYDSDLEQVEQVAKEVALEVIRRVPGAVSDAEPTVRFREFADSCIQVGISVRVLEFADQFLLKHELIKAIHKRFRRNGIRIPFPIRTLQLEPGLKTIIKESVSNNVRN